MATQTKKNVQKSPKTVLIVATCVLLSGVFCLNTGFAQTKPLVPAFSNSGIMLAQVSQANNKQLNDNELVDKYISNKGYSSVISFNASNIKQFWIDKSVSSQNGEIKVLLNKSKDAFESVPLKIQLANVREDQDCKVDIVTSSPDIDFSIVNNKSKVLSTKTSQDTFIQNYITSASFHLEDSESFSFNLILKSKSLSSASVKGIYLSFSKNKSGSYLSSPGKIVFTKDNVRLEGINNSKWNPNSVEITGKTSRVVSKYKIYTSNNVFNVSVHVKNIGEKPTRVYVGYIPYSVDGIKLDLTNYPYNDINNVLKVISTNKEKGTIIVDKYPEWRKGCYLASDAKEDMSDIPCTNLVAGTIANIKKIEDQAEITMSVPLSIDIEKGASLRITGLWHPYLYTNEKVLNPGEEEMFKSTIKHDDQFLKFSSEAISRGVYYVVPAVLSYSVDSKEENTVEVSEFNVSF